MYTPDTQAFMYMNMYATTVLHTHIYMYMCTLCKRSHSAHPHSTVYHDTQVSPLALTKTLREVVVRWWMAGIYYLALPPEVTREETLRYMYVHVYVPCVMMYMMLFAMDRHEVFVQHMS